MKFSSWGNTSQDEHKPVYLNDRLSVGSILSTSSGGIPYGAGKSYGDICLNPNGPLYLTSPLSKFINYDAEAGNITCESGVTLKDLQRLVISDGWLLPVTPGTELITIGGAIANDVHGKNHSSQGTFGNHILEISLCRTDGSSAVLFPGDPLFHATIGGAGLTGIVTQAKIKLKKVLSPWIRAERLPFRSLNEFFYLSDSSDENWEHTVSWIDCTYKSGVRGLFMRGSHIESDRIREKKYDLNMPFTAPFPIFNNITLKILNTLYFNINTRQYNDLVYYEDFFYPLDKILHWNRMYGKKGFYQYQCVIPDVNMDEGIADLLKEISLSGEGSFLGVLKKFGDKKSMGMMSFPMPGVTLALDFPNRNFKTIKLFSRLDSIVKECGGRIYLAKDANMSRELFELSYTNFNIFKNYRDSGICSALSKRLMD